MLLKTVSLSKMTYFTNLEGVLIYAVDVVTLFNKVSQT